MPTIHARQRDRRGAIAVLAAFTLVVMLAMVAFAIDIGVILVAKSDLQRSADAAAHAAAVEYCRISDATTPGNQLDIAGTYVGSNKVLNEFMRVSASKQGLSSDVTLGHINFANLSEPMSFANPALFNAVRVTVRRDGTLNPHVPLFFGKIFAQQSVAVQAESTAAVIRNISGFKIPHHGENLPFLPIVISLDMWESGLQQNVDSWSWNSGSKEIGRNPDGVPEVVLFPNATDSSGNLGTVNVGPSNNNSTSRLSKQIRSGLNPGDLQPYGGEISLDSSGQLPLSGNPGLSASLQDDLASIAGEPRIVGLFSKVVGSGSTADFTIVKFVAIRLMTVNLSSGEKYVTVQPAPFTFSGVLESQFDHQTSGYVFSPTAFVR